MVSQIKVNLYFQNMEKSAPSVKVCYFKKLWKKCTSFSKHF